MKKLFLILASLFGCFALAIPAFADVLPIEPQPLDTTAATEAAQASAEAAGSANPVILPLVIGVVAVAAGLILWLLLRKREK